MHVLKTQHKSVLKVLFGIVCSSNVEDSEIKCISCIKQTTAFFLTHLDVYNYQPQEVSKICNALCLSTMRNVHEDVADEEEEAKK